MKYFLISIGVIIGIIICLAVYFHYKRVLKGMRLKAIKNAKLQAEMEEIQRDINTTAN